ncbi:hypothetical protein EDD29_1038 [Actinocorallia herbida]|uniref:Uncharacterized protein n=1 Tax=Actinocorallia herbida TaxID=58109 RepID=A0A3N1CQQ3_9ACTN|nr:hypothetical protein [Actinocorallia herbida]ROO83535.1 hypothetical protein EDD29_1038 [Actinocorallia herbida]
MTAREHDVLTRLGNAAMAVGLSLSPSGVFARLPLGLPTGTGFDG